MVYEGERVVYERERVVYETVNVLNQGVVLFAGSHDWLLQKLGARASGEAG